MPEASAIHAAAQVLADHLARSVSDDVIEASGLLARDRDDELLTLTRRLARTADAYGTPARDVLAAVGVPAEVIAALDV